MGAGASRGAPQPVQKRPGLINSLPHFVQNIVFSFIYACLSADGELDVRRVVDVDVAVVIEVSQRQLFLVEGGQLRKERLDHGRVADVQHAVEVDVALRILRLDLLAETAWTIPGVLGSRMTGGGFGGCTVSIVKDEAIEDFKKTVGENYKNKIIADSTDSSAIFTYQIAERKLKSVIYDMDRFDQASTEIAKYLKAHKLTKVDTSRKDFAEIKYQYEFTQVFEKNVLNLQDMIISYL